MSVHNGQKFLSQALDSILNQSFKDFEFIVADDASDDDTARILNSVEDQRIRVITLKTNIGLTDALNMLISEARGMYIARMDADDISYEERLEKQVEYMTSDPRLVLLGTCFDYIDSQGHSFLNEKLLGCDAMIRKALIETGNQFCHPSVMFKADSVKSIGGYRNISGRYAQDYDLWLRLSETGMVANLDLVLLGYRIHDSQLSQRHLVDQRRSAEIYRILAIQRSNLGIEDYKKALDDAACAEYTISILTAGDLLRWSTLYYAMGKKKRAYMMRIQAYWLKYKRLPGFS